MNPQINSVLDAPVEAGFVLGQSAAMLALNAMVTDIARTDISVLLIGESGTGKEAYARLIHRMSRTPDAPLKKISCATLDPGRLLGQVQEGVGAAVSGDPACLFLDAVEELDLATQRALASILPDGEPEPGRSNKIRLISATSVNLDRAVDAGQFRRELYFRLNGASLRLPPLRERKEDIPALIEHFLMKRASGNRESVTLNAEAMETLLSHSWPGNIRELENLVKKMLALADTNAALGDLRRSPRPSRNIVSSDEPKMSSLKVAARAASRRTERELILKALERTHWNRKRAAQELQISYKSLLYKIKQIYVPGPGSEEL
jgi:two-component system, NtrC family, response regulator AtoC